LEPGNRTLGPAGLDELARDGDRKLLAGLGLPDDEAAAGLLPGPAGVALAVLHDVAAADRARPEVGARYPHVLELGVELADRVLGELDDVAHERLAGVAPGLDPGQAMLPVPGQTRRGQRVLAEQADDVQPFLCDDQGTAVALDVADLQQPLDDRRAGRRGADPGVLHRLTQLLLLDEPAGGLHRRQQRALAVAPR